MELVKTTLIASYRPEGTDAEVTVWGSSELGGDKRSIVGTDSVMKAQLLLFEMR